MGHGGGRKHLCHLQDPDGKEHHQAHPHRLPESQSEHALFRGPDQSNKEQTGELRGKSSQGKFILESNRQR